MLTSKSAVAIVVALFVIHVEGQSKVRFDDPALSLLRRQGSHRRCGAFFKVWSPHRTFLSLPP